MKLYDELAAYAERPLELVRLRCQYAAYELAWLWKNRKGNYEGFYSESDLYLYDLTEYQTRLHAAGWHEWLAWLIKEKNIKSILDFGSGIGESAITAWDAGVRELHCVEVSGSAQRIYADCRFRSRNMDVTVFNQHYVPVRSYDLIIAMDVLEHLEDPETRIRHFHEMTSLLISNCDNLPYGILYPQHISHPMPEPLFTKTTGNLWEAVR